jgi:hypothetical protein
MEGLAGQFAFSRRSLPEVPGPAIRQISQYEACGSSFFPHSCPNSALPRRSTTWMETGSPTTSAMHAGKGARLSAVTGVPVTSADMMERVARS